jgi:hypothetical protein
VSGEVREQKERLVNLKARDLAEMAWEEVELRFARGADFEKAKRDVLEERVPGYLAEFGDAVADRTIQLIMATPKRALRPAARRAWRESRWRRLTKAYFAAGGEPLSWLDRKRFDWFGRVPPAVTHFAARHGPSSDA